MSGMPNIPQIRELHAALAEISKEREEIRSAQNSLRHYETVVSCASERLAKQLQKARDLLDAMDCGPNGNAGSENRMIALLTGLQGLSPNGRGDGK